MNHFAGALRKTGVPTKLILWGDGTARLSSEGEAAIMVERIFSGSIGRWLVRALARCEKSEFYYRRQQ